MPATVTRRSLLAGSVAGAGALTFQAAMPSLANAAGRVSFGAYTSGMDGAPSRLSALGRTLGQTLSIASVFRGDGDVWPGPVEAALTPPGGTLLVSWHLDYRSYAYWASSSSRVEIAAVARRVKAFGRTVAIRPWAEMNGDWQPFQPTAAPVAGYASGYAAFIAAWRHLVAVFRAEGVTNVRWVFNPTTDTYAETTDVRRIWPGSSYVNVLGLDGYNWGTAGSLRWRSFADIYATQYGRLVALAPTLPVWICEVGCADPASPYGTRVTAPLGASKATWWRDAAVAVERMPSVRAVVLFDMLKERDWRAASSASALTGLRAAMSTMRTF
jgi:mannan endo-1,4-beta-mannosidase